MLELGEFALLAGDEDVDVIGADVARHDLAVVQLAQGVDSCEQLESAVRSGPIGRDLEFRYHPHVTIAHHVDDGALTHAFEVNKHYEAAFTVSEFHLYFQEDDGVWSPVESFTLQGRGSGAGVS